VVVDLPGRTPQRVVGDVRPKHARLDAGGLDDVPDRLIVPVEVVREPDEIEAGIAGAGALPVDDPGERAVVAGGCSNTTVTFSNPSERGNAASAVAASLAEKSLGGPTSSGRPDSHRTPRAAWS